ncbi:MAG: mechanosensitive ion channel [Desulfobacterales bacterium]|nr:mechanosensitive ion channel [Desulfobacterales bacterium]
MRLFLFLLLFLLMFPAVPVAAESPNPLLNPHARVMDKPPATTGDNTQEASGATAFPGLPFVGPRASELKTKADDTRKIISTYTQTVSQTQEIDDAERRFQKRRDLVLSLSEEDNWDTTKLVDDRLMLLEEKKGQEVLRKKISSILSELELNKKDWERRQTYWREWDVFLGASNSKTLSETFNECHKVIKEILKGLNNAISAQLILQDRLSRLLEETLKLVEIVETAFSRQRSNLFKKHAPSLFNTEFYAQFNSAFWRALPDGAGKLEDLFDSRSAWRITTRIFILFIVVFLTALLRKSELTREDWPYLLHHPVALGVFLSEVLSIVFFGPPTGLGRDFSYALLTFSSFILISAFLKVRLNRFAVCFLAALVVVPGLLKMIFLPSPLFRLYWAGTTLTGTVLFSVWARQVLRGALPKNKLFSGFLRGGAVVMALAALAQMAGFVSFSEELVLFTLKIAFLFAGIFLLLQISRMTLQLLLGHSFLADRAFIRHFGKELGSKLRTLLNVVIWGLAFFSFFSIIGVYSSPGEAFEKLFLVQIAIGTRILSPALFILAALVLYLSSFISWIIRSILESEVFPRIQMEKGAGQSVTKLLHYCLMVVGFLIGVSVIGLDLKSFAVLGGALGIGIGFGLQNIVNNFISGMVLLFERPVRVGDRIQTDDHVGIVKKIGLRSTVIETLDESQLIIPNSHLVSEKVTNWTRSNTIARLKIPVGVAYNSDVGLVFDTLTAAALANPRVRAFPEPIALLLGFGDSCLNMELRVWLTDVNQIRLAQSEISREIIRRFAESGIEIPFPQQEVKVRYDGNAQAIGAIPVGK